MTQEPATPMHVVHVLASVLALQSQASHLGVDVSFMMTRTSLALQQELTRLPGLMCAPRPVAAAPVPAPVEEEMLRIEPEDAQMYASRCRALFLEIIRRAAHDWVLYRGTRKRQNLLLAQDAYVWLFEEKPGHPWWEQRQREGEPLMAFETLCDVLDIDPDVLRQRVRRLTPRDIMTAGRPAENRKVQCEGVEDYEAPEGLEDYDISDVGMSQYESQFAVHTY